MCIVHLDMIICLKASCLSFFYFIFLFKKIKKIKIVHLDKVDDHLFEGELLVFWSHVVLPFRLDDALPVDKLLQGAFFN